LTAIGLILLYNPPRQNKYPDMTWMDIVWACDPIGSFLFITGSLFTLLALDWGGGLYEWSEPRVIAVLTIGLVLLVVFALYGEFAFVKLPDGQLLT
jgi:hypothetical protein